MTLAFSTTLRNARADAITAARDAALTATRVRIYDGARPTTGGAPTTLLAELEMSDPSAIAAVNGILTASPITDDNSADGSGTATWFREVDGDGVFIMDGDAGIAGSGAELILNLATITAGLPVRIISYVTTEGNS